MADMASATCHISHNQITAQLILKWPKNLHIWTVEIHNSVANRMHLFISPIRNLFRTFTHIHDCVCIPGICASE